MAFIGNDEGKRAESHQNFRLTPQKQMQFLGQTARGRCRFIAELHCAAVSSWLLSLVQQEGAKKRNKEKGGRNEAETGGPKHEWLSEPKCDANSLFLRYLKEAESRG